jgi:hypothetical protein
VRANHWRQDKKNAKPAGMAQRGCEIRVNRGGAASPAIEGDVDHPESVA